jgi:gamma-glutamyltranspeptidase/glutathione hydrolase
MAEAMRRANYDRARFLGDPAFVQIPAKLTTPEYGRQLAKTIDLDKATPSRAISADIQISPEGHDTTQFSIIDRKGMAVSSTYTLERLWGSRVVVKNMGFLLNNQMRAFNLFPGVTDTNGMIGTAPNTIAPGKRPISSMAPTIVAQDGRVKLVTGSPGSQAIPHTMLCILLNTLDFGMPLRAAIESPRMSHQWFPDQITFEAPERYPEAMKSLRALGHTIVPPAPLPFQGDAHSIWVTKPNRYIGVADRRRSDQSAALGY